MTLDETANAPIVDTESDSSPSRPTRTGRQSKDRKPLTADCIFDRTRPLADALRQRVIGQDHELDNCDVITIVSGR